MSSDRRHANEPLFAVLPQFYAASLHSRSENSHCSNELLDELKENISPLRPSPAKNVDKLSALKKNAVDHQNVDDHLLIVEDMGTPLRRTTFIRDNDHCSPKYVTRTPERRIVNVDGFRGNSSSPQAVPDCYATPLRRTTFVKNSPKLQTECSVAGHIESSLLFGKLPMYRERTVLGTVDGEIRSHVHLDLVPDKPLEGTSNILKQYQKPGDLLRDVSKSPLILKDRLLHLHDTSQSDKPSSERPRSSATSSRCSPSESEYHTAVTTPFDQSFSRGENDEFVDLHVCSETITGDVSLCQLALNSGSDVTFMDKDYTEMENMAVADSSKLPMSNDSVDLLEADIVTTVTDKYEVQSEIVSEVLTSEIYVTEITTSLHTKEAKPNCLSADVNTVWYEHEMADIEHAENEHFFHSAGSTVQGSDIQYNADILSNTCVPTVVGDEYLSTGYDACKRLSSTPLLNHEQVSGIGTANNQYGVPVIDSKLHEEQMTHLADSKSGVFRIPFDNDMSCSFNSRTFTKVCATPSFTADMSEDIESYNRTYSKSASHNFIAGMSGPRSSSRPLFTDSTVDIKSTEDASDGVLPLDMTESVIHETLHEQSGICRACNLPKPEPELLQCSKSLHPSGVWSSGDMSVMDRAVFTQVGGPTRHMISPGHKRQSLIARLHNDGEQHHLTQSSDAVVSIGHDKREHLEADGSPVRKRPLMAASKPSECYFSVLF